MNKNQRLYRIGLVSVSLLLVVALLAIALPQKAAASVESNPDPNANFTAYVKNGKLYINLSAPKEDVKYKVRVKDAAKSTPKFYDLGWLKADKKQGQKVSYGLPKAIRSALHLDVCLKNQRNDRLTCKKVYNPGL
jgi:hypothetical protein